MSASVTVSGSGVVEVSSTGHVSCLSGSASSFNSNASIDFNGTNAYLNFADDADWGDLGGLTSSGEDYCFGWVFKNDWQLPGSFDAGAFFSRNLINGWALEVGTSYQYSHYTGSNGSSIGSGVSGWDNDKSGGIVAGDAIQYNFDSSTYEVKIYVNGVLRETHTEAALRVYPQTSGVVRWGYPVTPSSGSYEYYEGKISGMWFARNHLFSDGQVSLDQSSDPDITGKSYYSSNITSFFNLGNDTYPNVVDLKGNVTTGTLVNGTSSDFSTS